MARLPSYQGVPGVPIPKTGGGGTDVLHPLLHALANVATLGTADHPQETMRYLEDLARSFNPFTPEGQTNLATSFFVPGDRMPNPTAEAMLSQLHNVRGGDARGYLPPNLRTPYESYDRPVTHVIKDPYGEDVSVPVRIMPGQVKENPEVAALVEKLGYSGGNPDTILHNLHTKGSGNSFNELRSKLGLHPDTIPTPRFHDPIRIGQNTNLNAAKVYDVKVGDNVVGHGVHGQVEKINGFDALVKDAMTGERRWVDLDHIRAYAEAKSNTNPVPKGNIHNPDKPASKQIQRILAKNAINRRN